MSAVDELFNAMLKEALLLRDKNKQRRNTGILRSAQDDDLGGAGDDLYVQGGDFGGEGDGLCAQGGDFGGEGDGLCAQDDSLFARGDDKRL
jgi:hypothetical protein